MDTTNVIDFASHRTRKLTAGCRNQFMLPLRADAQQRIADLIGAPSPDTWGAAHSIIINGRNTLWQALIDHTDFRTGIFNGQWTHIPDPAHVTAAIVAAVDEPGPAWDNGHLELV